MVRSHVVTGAGRGIGRAIAERLPADGDAVVVALIEADLAPVLVGSAVAVRRFQARGTPGAIVNVSATRPSARSAAHRPTPPPRPRSRG